MPRHPLPPHFVRFLATLAGTAVITACSKPEPPPPPPRPVLVQAAAPAEGSAAAYTGEIRARHESDLAFRVGGKIIARLVDAGAEVKAGTPLARLDPVDLELAVQSAKAQLQAAESDHATAKAERERYADLVAKRFVSQTAFEAKDNAYKAAQSRLEQARAQAAVSGNQASYGTLTADRAGIITAIQAEAGQVVSAGQSVMRLARPEEKEVAIAVPESRLAELKAAKQLRVALWAQPDMVLTGHLRELTPAADAATRTYAARIRLEDPPPSVLLGMTAQVTLGATNEASDVQVPLGAVADLGHGPMVWTVTPAPNDKTQATVHRRPVSVAQFRERTAVVSTGLKVGELVVVAGTNRLAEGQVVRPQPVTPPEKQR